MASRFPAFNITVPANTPISAPLTFSLAFVPGRVDAIDIDVPPGPSGNLGFLIRAGGRQYVPDNEGLYLIFDDVSKRYPVENANQQGSFQLVAYNTDQFAHRVTVTFLVSEWPDSSALPVSQYVSV
jgi:hypothetical protein